jgi:DNA-binding XRE family transcriptional regulator
MPRTPKYLRPETAPAAVTKTIAHLGANIAAARINRRWRQQDLAEKAGVSRQVIIRIEDGHLGVGIAGYVAALWAMGLHSDMGKLAAPEHDIEGQTLAAARLGQRVRHGEGADGDF